LAEHEVSIVHRRLRIAIGAGVLIAAAQSVAPAFAQAPVPKRATTPSDDNATAAAPCFLRSDWADGSWRATPDGRTIFIRVARSVYRFELQSSYSLLNDPFAILTDRNSTNEICSPLDLNLSVYNRAGAVQSPLVKKITRLTPAEAAALPKKQRP
jgi:hypothetical protein